MGTFLNYPFSNKSTANPISLQQIQRQSNLSPTKLLSILRIEHQSKHQVVDVNLLKHRIHQNYCHQQLHQTLFHSGLK